MNVLVTGGAGFIGSHVVRTALANGACVRVLDNLSTGWKKNLDGLGVEFIEGDIRDRERMLAWVADVDTVFHLAACIGNVKSLEDPWEDSEINVLGTVNLMEAARRAGVRCLVCSSSAATFGELRTMPIAEDHPQEPDSPYGVSKLAEEKHALCFGRVYGMQVVCLRYFNVYGVNQRYDAYGNVIPIFAERLHSSEPLLIYGDGEQTRDFVNVRDVAKINWLAATRGSESGVYNVGSGESITINRLANLVQEASGIGATAVRHVEPRAGEVRHCRADIGEAKRHLGFSPDADIAAGLREYFEWFRQQHGASDA